MKFYQSERIVRTVRTLGKITIVGLVAFGILTFIGFQYSAKSEFCTLCHFMQPYYDAWANSSHNMVPCVECHYPPSVEKEIKGKIKALTSVVQYFTGAYGKRRPWVEISDNSCLRRGCHNRRLLSGRANFGSILFDHTPHLTEMRRGKRLRCTSCHSQIVQREHMTVTNTTCFLCHFKRIAGEKTLDDCNLCHGAPLSPVQYLGVKFDHSGALKRGVECRKCHMHVIQGNGEVFKDRCFSCHTESEKLEKYADALLMHDIHVTKHKVDCLRCHDEIRHKILEMAQSVEMECISCHPNQHAAQKELFLGIGGHDVGYMPDPMFLTRVSCTSCHIYHKDESYQGTIAHSSAAACMSCHGTRYGAILDQWKRQMKNMLSVILPSLEKSKSELKKHSRNRSSDEKAKNLIEEARDNVELVRYGKGVHNIKYSVSLLAVANAKLKEAMNLIGSSYTPKTLPISQAVIKSECYSCHMGIEDKKTTFLGKLFDHHPHLLREQLPCERCHSNQRRHGETILSIKDCRICHHPDKSINCTTCHERGPTQALAYKNVNFLHSHHSIEQGLDCLLCHELKGGTFAIDQKMECFSCHHPMEEKNCESCHKIQSQIFSGEGVLDYDATPGVMSSSLGCTDCHTEVEQEKTKEVVKTSCENCHDESYSEIMDQWQEEVTAQVALIKGKINWMRRILQDLKISRSNKETEELVKSALSFSEMRVNLLEKDGSQGGHNYTLIPKMLEDANLKLEESRQLIP
ncbi:MAG: cytochrome c3 family protein [Candidatus Zixiibacteriota bacterium]